jgi:hypothetical protein
MDDHATAMGGGCDLGSPNAQQKLYHHNLPATRTSQYTKVTSMSSPKSLAYLNTSLALVIISKTMEPGSMLDWAYHGLVCTATHSQAYTSMEYSSWK